MTLLLDQGPSSAKASGLCVFVGFSSSRAAATVTRSRTPSSTFGALTSCTVFPPRRFQPRCPTRRPPHHSLPVLHRLRHLQRQRRLRPHSCLLTLTTNPSILLLSLQPPKSQPIPLLLIRTRAQTTLRLAQVARPFLSRIHLNQEDLGTKEEGVISIDQTSLPTRTSQTSPNNSTRPNRPRGLHARPPSRNARNSPTRLGRTRSYRITLPHIIGPSFPYPNHQPSPSFTKLFRRTSRD